MKVLIVLDINITYVLVGNRHYGVNICKGAELSWKW